MVGLAPLFAVLFDLQREGRQLLSVKVEAAVEYRCLAVESGYLVFQA